MPKSIKFSLYIESSDEGYSEYESVREVKPSDSIRSHAISVIKEAMERGVENWMTDNGISIDSDSAIQLYLAENDVQDPMEGYDKYGFGIKYVINNDQSIKVLNGYEPLSTDWTLYEIQDLVNHGYVKGNQEHVIIGVPSGLGAGGDLTSSVEWVSFLATLTAPVKLGWRHALYIFDIRKKLELQKVASTWKRNGILYPQILREFIDTKAEWKLSEVKKRLKLSEEYTIKLLLSLGYESVGNTWRTTHSKASISSRKKWLSLEDQHAETDHYTDEGDLVEMSESARLTIVVALLATIVAFITLVDNPVLEPIKIILVVSGFLQFLFLLFSAELLRFNLSRSVVRILNNPTSVDRWRKRFYDWSIQIYLLAFVGLGALGAIEYIAPGSTGANEYINNLSKAVFSIDQSNLGLGSLVSALLFLGATYLLAMLLRLIVLVWVRLRGGRK